MRREIHQVRNNMYKHCVSLISSYFFILCFWLFNIVMELTSENFNLKLAKKKSKVMWIVDYFASWCAPCQRLASEWIAVAKSLSSLSFVNVASIDCEAEASLCASQGIRSYPNIRMYPLGSEGLSKIA